MLPMFNSLRILFLLLCVSLYTTGFAQTDNPAILHNLWKSAWLQVPGGSSNGYGVYLFRKKIDLNTKPSLYRIHVSADNRYKLFVNEKLVSLGPARGDLAHWNYETVDLAPFLKAGQNMIAAQVWNEGDLRTEGHISLRTVFVLQGATGESQIVNTNE